MRIKENPTLPPLNKKHMLQVNHYTRTDYDMTNPISSDWRIGIRMSDPRGGYNYFIDGLPIKDQPYKVVAWNEIPDLEVEFKKITQ